MSKIIKLTPHRRKGRYVRKLKRRMKRGIKKLLVALIICAAASVWAMYAPQESQTATEAAYSTNTNTFSGVVSKVIDGDTFAMTGQRERVRVWGLDAPELGSRAGEDAAKAMEKLVQGQNLDCLKKDADRYGRIVARCSLPNGRDIAEELIKSGAAREYCFFSKNAYGTC